MFRNHRTALVIEAATDDTDAYRERVSSLLSRTVRANDVASTSSGIMVDPYTERDGELFVGSPTNVTVDAASVGTVEDLDAAGYDLVLIARPANGALPLSKKDSVPVATVWS